MEQTIQTLLNQSHQMDRASAIVNPEYLKHMSPLAWLDLDKAEEIINSTEMKRVFHAVVGT